MLHIILKNKGDRLLKERYPWVFNNQIKNLLNNPKAGDIVSVLDSKGRFLGKGFFNPISSIVVRILSFEDIDIDENFFYKRITQSIEKRKNLISKADAFRLISSEADGLPTLIVDKYRDYLVMQTLGVATEMRKNLFADILCQILKPKGIYERNDVPIRKLEGLSSNKGLLMGKIPELITITENRIRFFVDIKNGQKTGFYIDQRDNRNIVRDFSKEAKVLDCFCYTGGFSIYALYYGANHVTGIDISEESIKLAKRNAALNNFKDKKFIFNIANVFDELKNFDRCGEKFDLVVLDPPSFTRKKQTLKAAIRGYKEINLRAMKILKPGGVLITCSCSYHIGLELFKSMLIQASSDAKRTVRILDIRNHPMDHPILLQLKESSYLKCLVLEIV